MANPSSDVYGSDLQMLESARAFTDAEWSVTVLTPDEGSLTPLLRGVGATTARLAFPVLRRSTMSARGLLGLGVAVLAALPRMLRTIRRHQPDVVYVNTVTVPWWLLAARLARVPVVCHVHEAENRDSRVVRAALVTPLRLAHRLLVISDSAMDALVEVDATLRARSRLVRNGVPSPEPRPEPLPVGRQPRQLITVGRLSPRKAPDVALEACGILVERGHDVTLDIVGSCFEGYEWYERDLHQRAARPDLLGRVTFHGYVNPVWPLLSRADVVLMPSLREPFGNAVVEAQLARRPVVAADALGHRESIEDGVSGLLVTPGDAVAMADAAERLIADPDLARALADAGEASSKERFSVDRYAREVRQVVDDLLRDTVDRGPSGGRVRD